MFPQPNPAVLAEVGGADGVVYAMGSLYTSICPPLVLVGVGCTTLWNFIGIYLSSVARVLVCRSHCWVAVLVGGRYSSSCWHPHLPPPVPIGLGAQHTCRCCASSLICWLATFLGWRLNLLADCCREAIAARQSAQKLLLLNGSHDRETGAVAGGEGGMSAADVVQAVSLSWLGSRLPG